MKAAEPDLLLTQAICEVLSHFHSAGSRGKASSLPKRAPGPLSGPTIPGRRAFGHSRRCPRHRHRGEGRTHHRPDAKTHRCRGQPGRPGEQRSPCPTRGNGSIPLFCGGHWVPEMVEIAGGENCFGDKETGSFQMEWDAIVESQPEVIIFMPCGFDVKTRSAGRTHSNRSRGVAHTARG